GGEGNLRVWDPDTGEEIRSFGGFDARWQCWSPTRKTRVADGVADDGALVSGTSGKQGTEVSLWDPATGNEIRVFCYATSSPVCYSPCWSSDGKLLASVGCNTIHVWDPVTGKELRALGQEPHIYKSVCCLSPD